MNKKMVQFDRLEPYNDLPLLPPNRQITEDPRLLKKLVGASRALASVDGNLKRLPNPLMLVNTIGIQEARASTEIENIFTTEDELYKAISYSEKEGKINPATKEVIKYREALWAGYNALATSRSIDMGLIRNIFNQIKETTEGIRPPQANTLIRRGDSDLRPGEVIYTPPRGKEIIEKLMENLLDYLNDDNRYPVDPLMKMCIAHYQFEAIHPFRDGNGRTGRILNLLYLVSKGLLSQPVLFISKYIIENKTDYYFNLSSVTQRNSWMGWIEYMLDATEQTSVLTHSLIDDILKQMESTLQYAKKRIRWYGKEVNEAIFSQPYIRPAKLGEVTGKTSRTTLTKYMNELVAHRILRQRKDGSEVFYINDDLIKILEG